MSTALLHLGLVGCGEHLILDDEPKSENSQIQNFIGASCSGYGNIQCGPGLECHLSEEAKLMDDASGECRIIRSKVGEACAGYANTKCVSSAICKKENTKGFDINGICISILAEVGEQ